ncbi:hypothetical protein A374_10940 [Fictibacillus macauensis ZFHKF-1]|uniref:Copper amine oxidase n=1 Tax=Fictibacillus macauensis ZFHKF-1 TaxID=1196324 RepID=I8AIF0_9BACL|nr:hypothetical protein [Fictibacillus macauensis]EIT85254.1 hypothetical protein A374_10940 [Fictibacillus macauensis ZFHKF-1]
MKMKKSFVAIPLSLSLLLPTAGMVSAHEGHSMNTMQKGPVTVTNPAIDLRASLDQLLSEHAYLAVITMQKGADGGKDFQQAADALNNNTNDLSKAIASVYGNEAGQQFKSIWGSHIGYFVDYVKATGKKDEKAKQKARNNLANYRVKQAKFLASATKNRLKASDLEAGLKMHITELMNAFDHYVQKDYTTAYKKTRESINHMYGVGKNLAWAITDQFPAKFKHTKPNTAAADLREGLNYLLSEHAALAVTTMQKGAMGAKDFTAAANALSQNTNDLSKTIASVYGEKAGQQFKEIWSSHIGYFVDYVKATGNKDEKAKAKAMKNLDAYRVKQAKFLETATKGRLKASDLEAGLKVHVDELLKAFNSYVDKDYNTTYPTVREAYAHMFEVGKGLSGAIAQQFPNKFKGMPSMPKTGMGGASETDNMDVVLWSFAGLAAAAAMGAIVLRRKGDHKA